MSSQAHKLPEELQNTFGNFDLPGTALNGVLRDPPDCLCVLHAEH